MKKLLPVVLLALVAVAPPAYPQAQRAVASSITCPADGSSAQVLAVAFSRESYIVSNTSGATVRIGFLASGTADLTDSNSIQLLAGQIFSDAAPSIYIGRVVCMSNDATPRDIYVIETRRP